MRAWTVAVHVSQAHVTITAPITIEMNSIFYYSTASERLLCLMSNGSLPMIKPWNTSDMDCLSWAGS